MYERESKGAGVIAIRDDQRGVRLVAEKSNPDYRSFSLQWDGHKITLYEIGRRYSGPASRTIHVCLMDTKVFRDELTGEAIDGTDADLRRLTEEAIREYIGLQSPGYFDQIEVVTATLGEWDARWAPRPEPAPPRRVRVPWPELVAFVIGLLICAAWVWARVHT